jgi:hypothetical protein
MQLSANTQGGGFHFNRSSRKRLFIVVVIALLLLLAFLMAYYFVAPKPSNEQVIPQVQPPSLLENTSITTTVTLQHGSFTVVHTKTGVKITLTGSSLPDGSQINVTSIYYGSDPPQVHVVNSSTVTVSLSGIAFYDVKVIQANGEPLDSDGNALVYISNPRFEEAEKLPLLFYWNNKTWASVNTQTVEADTLFGPFMAPQLSGTLIGVGALQVNVIPVNVIPECPLGTALAVLVCFAAFALHRIRKKQTFSEDLCSSNASGYTAAKNITCMK